MIIDYTSRAEGSAVSAKGVIHRCPVCGKMGERRKNAAKTKPWRFIHRVRFHPSPTGNSTVDVLEQCTSPSAGDAPVAAKPTQMVLGR